MVPGHAPPSKPGLDPASHRISLNIRALFPPSSPRLNPTQAPVHTLYFRKCFRNTIPLALICHCSFYARARSFFFQNKWLVIERKKGPSWPCGEGTEEKAYDFNPSRCHLCELCQGPHPTGLSFSFMESRDCFPPKSVRAEVLCGTLTIGFCTPLELDGVPGARDALSNPLSTK